MRGAGRAARHRLRPQARASSTPPAGPREVPHYRAEAEKLARDYGYAEVEPLDRAGIAARARQRRLPRRAARPRRRRTCTRSTYALGLARAAAAAGVRIFEGSRVEAIEPRGRETGGRAGCGRASCVARRQRLSRRAGAGGRGAGDADQQLHRRDRAARREAARAALIRDDVAVADSRFVVNYFRLVRRPPAAVRRRRELRLALPAPTSPALVRPRMLGGLPRARRDAASTTPGAARWRSPSTGCRPSSGSARRSSPPPATPGTAWRWRRSPAS